MGLKPLNKRRAGDPDLENDPLLWELDKGAERYFKRFIARFIAFCVSATAVMVIWILVESNSWFWNLTILLSMLLTVVLGGTSVQTLSKWNIVAKKAIERRYYLKSETGMA
ncbi:hypothetical protein A3H26_02425 [candidate division WWE3 bacterium RIFCSPLOWO2_12_FULL_36_10]|uniref:Uncharacterized protein n=1 Tax=candidate division WWE3 bacterium RIFCSPLOWO2_12_FULL_36_10 TaxID=1802630 RepID=A0A1F4VIV4_UNCKA|nr:MAG: hypothetical protein A3H26_02425 [candidate division WWE3 bacterium RIFCSPLOWO2_12_FULL_36_10]